MLCQSLPIVGRAVGKVIELIFEGISKHFFGVALFYGFGEDIGEVLPYVCIEVITDPEQLLLLDGGREMLIFDAPEPDTGLGWGLHLGVPQSKPHTAVYYRLGGLIDQGCEVISKLGVDDTHKLINGVLVELLCPGHITQHLDGQPGSIPDLRNKPRVRPEVES